MGTEFLRPKYWWRTEGSSPFRGSQQSLSDRFNPDSLTRGIAPNTPGLALEMQTAILQPSQELFHKYEEHAPTAPVYFTENFAKHPCQAFNHPQLSAIHWAAMHTAAGTTNGLTKKQDPWPFTLVQGPPGTGKTHTVDVFLAPQVHGSIQRFNLDILYTISMNGNIKLINCYLLVQTPYPMENADLARIINSDEVQSVVRPIKTDVKRAAMKKNPLKNLNTMLRDN
ncbi:helicase Sen1-like protein isoform X2 [Tanacetum coccineum]|uniref:Helicase Sen1-like protein isoform X2 n=1 Tax=Tanacetum coccineum TaxID=301880 RepID=A0ABQ5EKL3_9ASTR